MLRQNNGQEAQAPVMVEDRNGSKMDVPVELEETSWSPDGQQTTRRWLRGRFLGKGGFAEVFDLTDRDTGEKFAGKVIAKSSLQKKRAKEKLTMEIQVHRSLQHRNIVRFVSYFEVADFYVIVLELCSNKSMMELLKARKRLNENEARYYLKQMIDGLKYMHSHRIIHRDLKLGNIFLSNTLEIKIGDFGLATRLNFDDERKKTVCGTPNYIAPEVLQGGELGHSYQVDIWSLGVILYTWVVGKPPFETNDVKQTYKRIQTASYYYPERVKVSSEAQDLIKRMLQLNPDERPTLDEIAGHCFFTRHMTPVSLPSTALTMEPKLPDMTKRVHSAPAVARHPDNANSENMLNLMPAAGVPSTAAALYVPTMRSPRGTNGAGKSPARGGATLASAAAGGGGSGSKKGMRAGAAAFNPSGLMQQQAPLQQHQQQFMQMGSQPFVARAVLSPTTQQNHQQLHQQHQLKASYGSTGLASAMAGLAVSKTPSTMTTTTSVASSLGGRENIVDLIYQTLVHALEQNEHVTPGSRSAPSRASIEGPPSTPLVWIQRFGDYTEKYGLAYQFNTGSFGSYFNDTTVMTMDPAMKAVEYNERTIEKRDTSTKFTVDDFPSALTKKVHLLQYFCNYLPRHSTAVSTDVDNEAAARRVYGQPLVHVRKFLKTRHAFFFRLTDNTLQVNFIDNNTGIVLSSRGTVVSYLDRSGQMTTLWLQDVFASEMGHSIKQRLMYIKDMLKSLIKKRGAH